MKTLIFTTMIVVFFVLSTNGIQAQTTQTKVDQIKFMENFWGSWTAEWGKDTFLTINARPFGKGSERDWTLSTKGKIFDTGRMLYGYDAVNDNLVEVNLYKSTPNIIVNAWWATSKTTAEGVPYKDIANPKNAPFRFNCVIKSPDLFVTTYFMNNNVVGTYTFTRVKKWLVKTNTVKTQSYENNTFTLTWTPERIDVSLSGDIGYAHGTYKVLSTGSPEKQQEQIGNYATIWRKQKDNTWKVVFEADF